MQTNDYEAIDAIFANVYNVKKGGVIHPKGHQERPRDDDTMVNSRRCSERVECAS
jgi:hypothetical protein